MAPQLTEEPISGPDLIGLVVIGMILYDIVGLLGAVGCLGLLIVRVFVPPIYLIVLAHILLGALIPTWPPAIHIIGFEVGVVLIVSTNFVRDIERHRLLAVFTITFGLLGTWVIILTRSFGDVVLPALALVGVTTVAMYAIHRYEIVQLHTEKQPT